MKNLYIDSHLHLFNFNHISISPLINRLFRPRRILFDSMFTFVLLTQSVRDNLKNFSIALEKEIIENISDVNNSIITTSLLNNPIKILLPLMLDFEGSSPHEKLEKQYTDLKKAIDETTIENLYIFPFIGINLDRFKTENELGIFLNKWFSKLIHNEKLENGDVLGIKLYPPMSDGGIYYKLLNNDPVAIRLFDFCLQYDIPLTIHCSFSGFNINDFGRKKQNPNYLLQVYKKYPKYQKMRINIAHFGGRISLFSWKKTITKLLKYENTFSDLSYIGSNKKYMKNLLIEINKHDHLLNKIIFGSDYPLHLLSKGNENYSEYLSSMLNTIGFKNLNKFSSENALKFLGNKILKLLPIDLSS